MNWQRILVPLVGIALVFVAWRNYGWPGVAAVVGGIVMWMLLHFTRMMKVLQRASQPDQRHAVTTLGEMAATIAAEGLASPAVIVVGDVVRGVAVAGSAVSESRAAGGQR